MMTVEWLRYLGLLSMHVHRNWKIPVIELISLMGQCTRSRHEEKYVIMLNIRLMPEAHNPYPGTVLYD
jgi:hypothetical protein